MPQLTPFNIEGWQLDDSFGPAFPEGARPKRAVLSPHEVDTCFLKADWRYLFKLSEARYPEQFWAEIIAYQISQILDIPVPPAFAALDSATGECGALIEWFYEDNREIFTAAGNYFQNKIQNFDRKKGTQHNIETAIEIYEQFLGRRPETKIKFYEMLMFDALIGNTDRHQDNWGIIFDSRYPNGEHDSARFSPWFDNGTSLGHERFIENVQVWSDQDLERYLRKGRHHFRATASSTERLQHTSMLSEAIRAMPELAPPLRQKLRRLDLSAVEWILSSLVSIEMPPSGRLTQERADFIMRLTTERYRILSDIVNV
ncbi:hypothetical protein D3C84_402960 [compost metagenome]